MLEKEITTGVRKRMDSANLLSIVIPTRNRLSSLQRLIYQLLEIRKLWNFDICVSDNASTDGSVEYLKKISKDSGVNLICNSENIGIDKNMLQVARMAKTRYVWPLADDETLVKENFQVLYNTLLNQHFDMIILNGEIKGKLGGFKCVHKLLDSNYENPVDMFKDFWGGTTYGLICYDRSLLDLSESSRFIGSFHAYTGVLWNSLAELIRSRQVVNCRFIANPLIRFHPEIEKSWKGYNIEVIYDGILRFFDNLDSMYSQVAIPYRDYYINQQLRLFWIVRNFSDKSLSDVMGVLKGLEYRSLNTSQIKFYLSLPLPIRRICLLLSFYSPRKPSSGFDARNRLS